ncbi:transcription initiation factor TFIID subunit 2-like [Actinia tenebrosa]|uniref:Transcription initiation factor TFIID subunit 2 n=1 Tax=Actinia tenebrosa TaxID=6105 RepID=A0A6P8HPF3_ACTTE|nr:transcription initiation factor TFIID subunit 2-like [Actinia tenebrosa]
MSKQSHSSRNFKLVHQTLCITSIDFQRKCLFGFVELRILPLVHNLTRLKLNCKQCRIMRICIRDERKYDWYEAGFQLDDQRGKPICGDAKKRNLDYFLACQQNSVCDYDPDKGGGELTLRIPKEVQACAMERRPFRVSIEYSLDHPETGIQFITPKGEATMAERSAHLFTYGYGNSSRNWFPCVDSYSEVCTWSIDITTDKDMIAVSCGELTDQILSADEKSKTFQYVLNIPTCAPNIALAVGPFEVHVDPIMPEVTNFCLPGLLPYLKHTSAFLHDVFEFYEEHLSCRFPYAQYKQVFVDEAYDTKMTYASMGIFNTSLLHSPRIIDQTFQTRKVLAQALAEQFFGCYICMQDWSDAWLCSGISDYLYGLFVKKVFGNNEYRHYIMKENDLVCQYEMEGPGLPPLHSPLNTKTLTATGSSSSSTTTSDQTPIIPFSATHLHPQLIGVKQKEVALSKAHLVLRMIENRIGQEPLLQVFNKLLSLANTTAQPKVDPSLWKNLLASTSGFLKSISTVSGKDINVFVDQWICHTGIAKFHGSFVFNRKRNIVELDIKQDLSKGTVKYVGPLTVCIQELDGSFNHTVQIEDITSRHELPCHSKSRRNKKKKIPLMTGEEVDMNLDSMDSDSPVLWIRIDPEVTWLRHVSFEQPDYMWQYQLRHERDVMAQAKALEALAKFPTPATREALIDIVKQKECFYRIRQEACHCLAKVASSSADSWAGHAAMLNIFKNFYSSKSCPQIIRYNDFSNFLSYFLLKTLPVAIASIRNIHTQCPREILQFLLDLLKYNDNRINKYSDDYYIASLIDALATTVTPGVCMTSTTSTGKLVVKLKEETQLVLTEVTRRLNLEKLLPSYRYTVTVSCLKALRTLQVNGQVPADSKVFEYYSSYGHYEDVRKSAIDCLVESAKVERSEQVLSSLLNLAEKDPCPFIRHYILRSLAENPPFTRKTESPLCTVSVVEKLWQLMNTVNDARLRCDSCDVYNALFGRLTPTCVPAQGMGIVIDLKEKKIMNLSPLAIPGSPSGSVSDGESTASKKSHKRKRKTSRPHSPSDLSHIDSQPGTPMSMESACSEGAKLKLKIKFGNEESGVDSGAESRPKETDSGLPSELRKHKKKKKKHKHKDEKGKRKMSTSSSNYDSPLMFDANAVSSI